MTRSSGTTLPALRAVTEADIDDDSDLDEVELAGTRGDELVWSSHRRISSARIVNLTAANWQARGLELVECSLDRLDVVTLAAAEGRWRDVTGQQSRLGSAELYGADWQGVHLVRCKIGFLNLRHAKLTDVAFTDCVIDELDLLGTTAVRVAFPRTRIGRLELSKSTLTDVDLRESHLAEIGAADGLRGATISYEQLIDLARTLANQLGIQVV